MSLDDQRAPGNGINDGQVLKGWLKFCKEFLVLDARARILKHGFA